MNKTRGKEVFWISIIILAVIGVIILWMKYGTYAQYWGEIGGRNYEQIVEKYGEPNEIKKNNNYDELYYDELVFHCVGSERNRVDFVIIEDEAIRFGILNIGVGSSKSTIKAIYFFKPQLQPVRGNSFAVTDWVNDVTFEFDEDDKVKKIYVCFHG